MQCDFQCTYCGEWNSIHVDESAVCFRSMWKIARSVAGCSLGSGDVLDRVLAGRLIHRSADFAPWVSLLEEFLNSSDQRTRALVARNEAVDGGLRRIANREVG
jgi:hypothetical protein